MAFEKVECKYKDCKNSFIPNRYWQKYCSYNCRKKAWNDVHEIKNLKELAKRVQKIEETLKAK